MNIVQRHPYWSLTVVAVLISIVHTMDYRDEVVAANVRYIERPATLCRLPDQLTEYRVILQYRIEPDVLLESCSIEPRNREESSSATMQRLLNRKVES